MNKKLLSIFVLILTFSFSFTAFASLTFTTNAITGTTASAIDLGAGNALSIQTTGNGDINLGSGLLTSTGSAMFGGTVKGLNVYEDLIKNNIAIGSTALSRVSPSNQSIAIGYNALGSLGSSPAAPGNIAIGYEAMKDRVSGAGNVGLGIYSLWKNISGTGNVAIGSSAGNKNVTGNYNVSVGDSANWSATGGNRNTSVGTWAQYTAVSGDDNTVVGQDANGYATAGSNNTIIGSEAGVTTVLANANLTGANNTWVGYNSGPGVVTQLSNSSAFGNGAQNSASNQIVLGNNAVTDVLMGSTSGATVNAGKYKLSALNTAPASAAAACTLGEIRWTNGYVYLCVATDTWQRAALTTW